MNPFRFPITSLLGAGSFLSFEPMNLIIEPSEGKGAVYLGNYEAASDVALLKKHGVKAVLTVAADLRLNYPSSEGFTHEVISAQDMVSFDLSKHFSRCFDFIDRLRAETNVLVHCLAGISRSATIVIMYLMRGSHMSFESAFSFVKKRRKIIFPNPGFVRQLRVFSSQLKGKGAEKGTRSRSKAKVDEFSSSANALRSLSLSNVQKKQEPISFKTPQKSYNYYNVNFATPGPERQQGGIKTINYTPQMKKPGNNTNNNSNNIYSTMNAGKNPYSQNLSKTGKKEVVTKSYEKLTPTKPKEQENFMFLRKKI